MNEFNGTNMDEQKKQDPSQSESSRLQSTAQVQDSQEPDVNSSKKIEELESQVREKEGKYVYLYAEFETYKRRMSKERADLLKYGFESAGRELIQVIDNLERALSHTSEASDKTLLEGLQMVLNQFRSALQKQGIEVIECLQKPFDPHLHEAVGREKSELPAETVVKELARGYTLHGRLLRPARVVISG